MSLPTPGTLCRVPEFTADELDELQLAEVLVTGRSEGLAAAEEAAAREAAKVLLPEVEQRLCELLEQLRQR